MDQRPQQIEDRAHAEGAAHRHGMANAAVILRRGQDTDADLIEAALGDMWWCVDAGAQRLHYIERAEE